MAAADHKSILFISSLRAANMLKKMAKKFGPVPAGQRLEDQDVSEYGSHSVWESGCSLKQLTGTTCLLHQSWSQAEQ